MTKRALALITGLAISAGGAHAMWMHPEFVPVDRLVVNLTQRAKETPLNAAAWYTLGRAHSLAYTLKKTQLGVFNGDPAPEWMQGMNPGDAKKDAVPTKDQLEQHLIEGIRAFSRALELEPNKPEYCLSLAHLLDAGKERAGDANVLPGVSDPADGVVIYSLDDSIAHLDKPENVDPLMRALGITVDPWNLAESRNSAAKRLFMRRDEKDDVKRAQIRDLLKQDWLEQTTELYFRAFAQNLEKDSKIVSQPMRGVDELVSYEAAAAYARIVKDRGVREQDKVRLATVQAAVEAWKHVPDNRAITPIVIALGGATSLNDLLDNKARVTFDLNGLDSGQTWHWLKPTTGLLVWDPERTGKITSGRQLFGSVSWWMMFENGYDALAALDDNRDGELRGRELSGIGVWFDRNSDGVSDAGEVTPVEKLGIAALSTRVTAHDGKSPMNPTGMTMTDGRVLPTWDWVTEPMQAKRADGTPLIIVVSVASILATSFLSTGKRRRTKLLYGALLGTTLLTGCHSQSKESEHYYRDGTPVQQPQPRTARETDTAPC